MNDGNRRTRMKFIRWIVPALLLLGAPVFAAEADLPLDVYQKFKAPFNLLYGAGNSLLTGAPVRSKEEVEKDLRADPAPNKDVLVRALMPEMPVPRAPSAMA